MILNFAFLRHGHAYHNVITPLLNNGRITIEEARALLGQTTNVEIKPLNDPDLTPVGIDASVHNGCIVRKILKNLGYTKTPENPSLFFNRINIVGCSPLIRSMESAYYMSRKWRDPSTKIYVFPFLREIDESSTDKYSKDSIKTINSLSCYKMKSIQEQKNYLREEGILEFFDFSYIETFSKEREEPRDIINFIKWFSTYFSIPIP